MEALTGSILSVGVGEVSVRVSNGVTCKYKTDRGFKYGQEVLVFFNYSTMEITRMIYPHELDKKDILPPRFPHREYQVGEEYPVDQEGSFPRPAVAPEEFEEEQESQEWE